jgi:hypothetical protein
VQDNSAGLEDVSVMRDFEREVRVLFNQQDVMPNDLLIFYRLSFMPSGISGGGALMRLWLLP